MIYLYRIYQLFIMLPIALVATSLTDSCFRYQCRTNRDISMAVTAVDACGVESEPLYVIAAVGGRMVRSDVIRLSEPLSWGQRIEVLDQYGRVVHSGRFACDFDVRGFAAGRYILNVYNRHNEPLYKIEFVR
jgi:hypothetical protein